MINRRTIGANWRTESAPIRKFTPKGIGIGASADGRLTLFGALSAQLGAMSGSNSRPKGETAAWLAIFSKTQPERGHHER